MAKTRKYRRYFRRYIRRYKKRYNANYSFCRLNFPLSLWMQNNEGGSAGTGFVLSGTTWSGNSGSRLNMQTYISDLAEFKAFAKLYNEFKILGVGIKAMPTYRAQNVDPSTQLWHGRCDLSYSFGAGSLDDVGIGKGHNNMNLDPNNTITKYWKNRNRHWYSINATTTAGFSSADMVGYLEVDSTEKTVLQRYCPSWNLEVTFYTAWRKNKLA